jgi:hypothetical protein
MRRAFFAALLALGVSGCSKAGLIDFAMRTAPRHASHPVMRVGPYQVLAGDMHAHVLPPDSPAHVSRDFARTSVLAREEGLDFVVLTPHVPSRFYMRPDKRAWVRETQATLRAQIAQHPSEVLFVPGMEYTDHRYGHVGLAFASLEDVLAEVSVEGAQADPALFFERWAARGGVMTINHPRLRGNPKAPISALRYDMGWRAFFETPPPVPPEIAWITEHAQTIETLNTSVSHLRDQFIIGDIDRSLRESTHLADRVARRQHRRFTGVGGSDSHGGWLRPTTWVLARERTVDGVREALTAGRTCVRGPEGCTLAARATEATWAHAGGSITTKGSRSIEVRSEGGPATYFLNGAVAARGGSGETVAIRAPGTCALVRAIVAESWSAPIYVDCAWAR